MMKQYLVCLYIIFSCMAFSFAEDLTYARSQTAALDIELSQVNLIVALFDGERIAYRSELKEGKKLSCIETQKTLRIRQLKPAEGTLYLFIPKQLLLEQCSIKSNRADIRLDGVQVVHLLLIMNIGSVDVTDCRLKNAVINLVGGALIINKSEVIRSAAINVNHTNSDITLLGEESEYHIDYVHHGGSFTIGTDAHTKSAGEYGNIKAKRRIIFSGGASTTAIRFIKKVSHDT